MKQKTVTVAKKKSNGKAKKIDLDFLEQLETSLKQIKEGKVIRVR